MVAPLRPRFLSWLLAALVLLLALPVQAQEWIDFDEAPPIPTTADAQSPSDEGIHVKGEWTITVRNSDGSVDRRRTFENGLMGGGFPLTSILRGDFLQPTGEWRLRVGDGFTIGGDEQPCLGDATTPIYCILYTSGVTETDSGQPLPADANKSLSVSTKIGEDNTTSILVIAGSLKAERDGNISAVRSIFDAINLTNNNSRTELNFTEKSLSTPIPISKGQTADVQVEVSFN
jgi:hypothetical protein